MDQVGDSDVVFDGGPLQAAEEAGIDRILQDGGKGLGSWLGFWQTGLQFGNEGGATARVPVWLGISLGGARLQLDADEASPPVVRGTSWVVSPQRLQLRVSPHRAVGWAPPLPLFAGQRHRLHPEVS